MKSWEESQDEVNKVRQDKEKAKALLKMIDSRLELHKGTDKEKFTTLLVETYYEIIKEGITALMAIDGYKTLSHEVLIVYLKKFYREFSTQEILLADQLRWLRNKIVYHGRPVERDYLDRNEKQIKEIIEKLRKLIQKKYADEQKDVNSKDAELNNRHDKKEQGKQNGNKSNKNGK